MICGKKLTSLLLGVCLYKELNGTKDSAQADRIPSNFLKAIFHKIYLVYSWILSLKYLNINPW